jgi:hypothetical protein
MLLSAKSCNFAAHVVTGPACSFLQFVAEAEQDESASVSAFGNLFGQVKYHEMPVWPRHA